MSSSDLGSTKHPRIRRRKKGGGGIDKTTCNILTCSPTLQKIKDFHAAKGAVFLRAQQPFLFQDGATRGLSASWLHLISCQKFFLLFFQTCLTAKPLRGRAMKADVALDADGGGKLNSGRRHRECHKRVPSCICQVFGSRYSSRCQLY